jgi:hypothetical protein
MILSKLLRLAVASISVFAFFFVAILTPGQTASTRPVSADEPCTKPLAIVIGFVGGFIAHDNPVHSEVQLAARLRKEYPTGVDVEAFESYREAKARQNILRLLDVNHDGTLTMEEK